MKTSFKGRDFITIRESTREELETVLDLAYDLKRKFATGETHDHLLRGKTLFMLFYNPSLRTRNSFEAGMTQLGGHAHYLLPATIYTPTLEKGELSGEEVKETGERISDSARVLSRYGDAIAIRIFGKPTKWIYGRGNLIVREFARWADISVINMECDMYHPCQAMADVMTIIENLRKPQGKKLVMSWAYAPSPWKPLSVPHSVALIGTKFGMNVVLAHPKGFELDSEIIKCCREYADTYGGSFGVSHNMDEAFEGADVVYPKSWTSLEFLPPKTNEPNLSAVKELCDKNKEWICNEEKMDLCKKNAIYMHCLPADRVFEVTDQVIDGLHSVVFDEAENRLHVQKAIMALTIGG